MRILDLFWWILAPSRKLLSGGVRITFAPLRSDHSLGAYQALLQTSSPPGIFNMGLLKMWFDNSCCRKMVTLILFQTGFCFGGLIKTRRLKPETFCRFSAHCKSLTFKFLNVVFWINILLNTKYSQYGKHEREVFQEKEIFNGICHEWGGLACH